MLNIFKKANPEKAANELSAEERAAINTLLADVYATRQNATYAVYLAYAAVLLLALIYWQLRK